MKVWLNNLKNGDIFYTIIFYKIYKCEHLGNNKNLRHFKMSTIDFKVLDTDDNNDNIIGTIQSDFVNKYVYDDYESAKEGLLNKVNTELTLNQQRIIMLNQEISKLENEINEFKNIIKKYEQGDNKEN